MPNKNPDDYVLITEENSKLIPNNTSIYTSTSIDMSIEDVVNCIDRKRVYLNYVSKDVVYVLPGHEGGSTQYKRGFIHKDDLTSNTISVDIDDDFLLIF